MVTDAFGIPALSSRGAVGGVGGAEAFLQMTFTPSASQAGREYRVRFGCLDTDTGVSSTAVFTLRVTGVRTTHSVSLTSDSLSLRLPPAGTYREVILRMRGGVGDSLAAYPTIYQRGPGEIAFSPLAPPANYFSISGADFLFSQQFTSLSPKGVHEFKVVARDVRTGVETESNEISIYVGGPQAEMDGIVTDIKAAVLAPERAKGLISVTRRLSGNPGIYPKQGEEVHYSDGRVGIVAAGAGGSLQLRVVDKITGAPIVAPGAGGNLIGTGANGNIIAVGAAGNIVSAGAASGLALAGIVAAGAGGIVAAGAGIIAAGAGGTLVSPGAARNIVAPGAAGSIIAAGAGGIIAAGAGGSIIAAGAGGSIVAPGAGGNIVAPGAAGSIIAPGAGGNLLGAAAGGFSGAGRGLVAFGPSLGKPALAGVADTPDGAATDADLFAHFQLWHAQLLLAAGRPDAETDARLNVSAAALDAGAAVLEGGFASLTQKQRDALLAAGTVIPLTVAPAVAGGVIAPGSRIVLTPTNAGDTLATDSEDAPAGGPLPATLAGSLVTFSGQEPTPAQADLDAPLIQLYGRALSMASARPDRIEVRLPDTAPLGVPQLIVLTTSDGRLALGAVTVRASTGAVHFSQPAYSANEFGGPATVTVTRTGGSAGTLIYCVAATDGTAADGVNYTSVGGVVVFADGDAAPKTFQVPILPGGAATSGPRTVVLTLANPLNTADVVAPQTSILNIGGIAVRPLGRAITTEMGGQFRFGVRLTTAPTADVTIAVASSVTAEGVVSQPTLTFTPVNALTEQIVTVTGVDDALTDGNKPYAVTLGNAVSADAGYNGLAPSTALFDVVNVAVLTKNIGNFVDADGDKFTVKLTGPKIGAGRVGVLLDDPNGDGKGSIDTVFVAGTDPLKSKLAVTVTKFKAKAPAPSGDGLVSVGAVVGSGLAGLTATASDLVGAGVSLNGYLGALSVRDIKNGADVTAVGAAAQKTTFKAHNVGDGTAVTVGSTVTSLKVARFGNGSVTAPALGTLTVTGDAKNKVGTVLTPIAGDFLADLTLMGTGDAKKPVTLTKATVAGAVTDATWAVTGNIGTVTVKKAATNWAVAATGAVASITAGGWAGGSLRAASVGTLTVNGDLTANVTLTGAGVAAKKAALNTLKVTGTATGVTIDVAGLVNTVTVGAFLNSRLFAGFAPTASADPMAGGMFNTGGKVNTFTAIGFKGSPAPAFFNSVIAAETIGTVTLASADTTTAAPVAEGVWGKLSIGAVTIQKPAPAFKYDKAGPAVQNKGNFFVKKG